MSMEDQMSLELRWVLYWPVQSVPFIPNFGSKSLDLPCLPLVSLADIPSQAAGLDSWRISTNPRPMPCICFSTTWDQVSAELEGDYLQPPGLDGHCLHDWCVCGHRHYFVSVACRKGTGT